jgi:multiple sugar transport system substrate-binding protein
MSRHDFEAQRLAIEAWNKENPGVQIKMDEVVGDTWDYYRIKMMQQLAAGNPPDTVFTDVWYFRMYSTDGVFVNLEPFIEKDADFKKEDLWPVVVENTRSPDTNGEMYCLPYDYGTHALAYNIKLFDELGIPHLDPNKEYDWEMDILPLAKELTIDMNGKKSTDPDFDPVRIQRYGVNPYNYLFWWYVTMSGGQCFDKDYTKSTINSPEAIDGINFLNNLMNVDKVAPSPAFQQSQPISFQTGNIAMSIVATWDIPGWAPTTDFEWDIVRPPRRKVKVGDGRASGFAFLSTTKYPEESWQWIKYNCIGHGQDFKQQGGGAIHPVKAKARNDLLMKRSKAPYNMEAFVQEAELGGGPPFFKYWHMYIDMVPAELTPAYNNEITVEEALNKAAEKTDYLLANGKLP